MIFQNSKKDNSNSQSDNNNYKSAPSSKPKVDFHLIEEPRKHQLVARMIANVNVALTQCRTELYDFPQCRDNLSEIFFRIKVASLPKNPSTDTTKGKKWALLKEAASEYLFYFIILLLLL